MIGFFDLDVVFGEVKFVLVGGLVDVGMDIGVVDFVYYFLVYVLVDRMV